jgi:hypothetical protein
MPATPLARAQSQPDHDARSPARVGAATPKRSPPPPSSGVSRSRSPASSATARAAAAGDGPKTPQRRSTVADVTAARSAAQTAAEVAAALGSLSDDDDDADDAELLRASLVQRGRTPPKKGVSFTSPQRARSNSDTELLGSSAGVLARLPSLKQMSPVVAKTAARRKSQEVEMAALRADVEEALRNRRKPSPGGTTVEDDLQLLGDEDARDSFDESFLGANSEEEEDDEDEEEEELAQESENLHGERIHVIVRKRPVSSGQTDVLQCTGSTIFLHEPKKKVDLTQYTHSHKFKYDNAFSEADNTTDLYRRSVHSLVHNLFQGGTSTCFCFGQTASGKTHTLFGQCGGGEAKGIQGIYQIAADRIFDSIDNNPGGLLPA